MQRLAVQIVRFVDEYQPGWVQVELFDADMRRHTFIDKVPIFTSEDLGPGSAYPRPGVIGCEVLSRHHDMQGRELVRITTRKPDGVESTERLFEFVVRPSQLSAT